MCVLSIQTNSCLPSAMGNSEGSSGSGGYFLSFSHTLQFPTFSWRFSSWCIFCFIGSGSLLGVAIENGKAVSFKCILYTFSSFPRPLNTLGNSFSYLWLSLIFPDISNAFIAGPPSSGSSKFFTTYRSCFEKNFHNLKWLPHVLRPEILCDQVHRVFCLSPTLLGNFLKKPVGD